MSEIKWAYDPELCTDQICPGDCNFCDIILNPEKYGLETGEDEYEEEMREERMEAGVK